MSDHKTLKIKTPGEVLVSGAFSRGWWQIVVLRSASFYVFSPTRLACGVLTVKKGYRLGSAERAVPPSPRTGSSRDLGTRILVPGSFVVNLIVNLVANLVVNFVNLVVNTFSSKRLGAKRH